MSITQSKSVIAVLAIAIIATFAATQFYKIYHTGIGTDEGNFLFTTKLLQEGKTVFLDFYSRESGPLILLVPFFKLFSISIIHLRYLVLLIHSLTISVFYLFLQRISPNKIRNLLILFISIIPLTFGGSLEIYMGIFYQLYGILILTGLYLLFSYYIKNNTNYLIILGLLTGLSIIIYKGAEVFWVLALVTVFLKQEQWQKYLKEITIFFLLSLVPILIYGIYYVRMTNVSYIYQLVLGDVLRNFILLFTIALLATSLFIKNKYKFISSSENILLISNIGLVIGLTYQVSKNSSALFSSFYGGLVIGAGFLLLIWELLNILQANKYLKETITSYLIINGLVLWQGFGSRGFFTNVSDIYYLIATFIIIIFSIGLLYLLFHQNYKKNVVAHEEPLIYLTIIFNIYLVITSLFGGYLMSTRFQELQYFLPLLLLSITMLSPRTKIFMAYGILVIISMIFSIFTNIYLPNDYTLYPINDFKSAVSFINTNVKNPEKVFSTDTAIMSEINNTSIINFYSPWQFIDDAVQTCSDNIEAIKGSDTCLNAQEMVARIIEKKPDYIVGSWRGTMRWFDSLDAQKFLEQNYHLLQSYGRISIFRKI